MSSYGWGAPDYNSGYLMGVMQIPGFESGDLGYTINRVPGFTSGIPGTAFVFVERINNIGGNELGLIKRAAALHELGHSRDIHGHITHNSTNGGSYWSHCPMKYPIIYPDDYDIIHTPKYCSIHSDFLKSIWWYPFN